MAEKRKITQPFPPVIDRNAKILILGSFPSVLAVRNGFYYGNPRNRFYDVLSNVLETDLVSMDWNAKKAVFVNKGIAIYDVIQSCVIEGSKDASIDEVDVADIVGLIKDTEICHVFLNGRTAGALFDRHFPDLKEIRTILPSTSPANAKMNLEKLISEWRSVLAYL